MRKPIFRFLRRPVHVLGGTGLISMIFINAATLNAQVSYAFSGNRYAAYQQTTGRITLQLKNTRLNMALEKIEKQVPYVFVYSTDGINTAQKITIDIKDKPVSEALEQLLGPLQISFEILNDKIILRNRTPEPTKEGGTSKNASGSLAENPVKEPAAFQQEIIITGKVTDNAGRGIANVSVILKGTATGTTTADDGSFTLRLPEERAGGTLVFSSVNFQTLELPIDNRRTLAVVLTPAENDLGEVIVVGYGTQRKVSVTGAVDAVGSKAIQGRPVVTLSQALQGISPNLIIQQNNFEPGQGVNINIRGLGTLGDNTPLIVVDGIIGADINLINPNDIESISVLKDAGSAAIYGSRSANGVILVTTKKGRKNEKATINYNGIYGIQSPRVTYQPVHAWENAYFKNESLVNSGQQPVYTPSQIQAMQQKGDGDWRVENILQNAPQQSHNISISGGSGSSTYLISAGYLDQKNNFVGPDYGYKRYNLRLNQSVDIGRFKLATILSYVKTQGRDHSFNSGTLIVDAGRVPLLYSFQDSAGNYLTNGVSAQFNPKGILEKGGYRRSNDDEISGNFSAEFAILKDLKIKGVFGGNVRSNQKFGRRIQVDFTPGGKYGDDREVFDENYKSLFTNTQLMLEYTRTMGQHDVRLLAGGANESFQSEQNRLGKTLTDPYLGTPTTGTVIDPNNSYNNNQSTTETSINSLFGRAGYSFMDRYFVEFNFRYDGSSKFAKDNRWGFFPSVAGAWRVTEEPFFEPLKNHIGDLKLRASYGILGNQNVAAYQYQTTYFNYSSAYAFNNTVVGGSGYVLGNPSLTWEKAATFNAGIDANLFNRRLDISFDYFYKTTSDILFPRQDVPVLIGTALPDYNVAKVRNRGWEVRASYSLPGRLISQTFSANLADNLNELLSLTTGATELVARKEEFEFLRRVGHPITVYQGYKRNGYFQTPDDISKSPKFAGSNVSPGDIKFVDRNGDGIIDDKDKFILGNPFPRYTFGFTYTLAVKGFDLSLFIQGVGRRDAMIRGELVEPFHVGYSGTMYKHQTDYWTPTHPNAKYPRLAEPGTPSNVNNFRTGSDIYLFNAAYARLKNLQIGYTLPLASMKLKAIRKARIYLTGQNLATLTNLSFLDPELTEFNNNTSFGNNANSGRAYPLPVFYGCGIDITF